MANFQDLNRYISKRYYRWLDYSRYHCQINKMKGEERDVLNEVLVSLLEKDQDKILKMLSCSKDGYTELDFFIMRMVYLNITSSSSPYQIKNANRVVNKDINIERIDLPDESEVSVDRSEEILAKMRKVRGILDELELSPRVHQIFVFHFFGGESFKKWEGPEKMSDLYATYNKVKDMVKRRISNESLF